MTWTWIAIAGYMALNIAVGAWASRFIKTESDYLVAGRSLGFGLTTVSLFATWFGAETVIGSSAAIAEDGLAGGRADPFGYSLCLLGMGLLLAYELRRRNYVTIGDFFRERYSRTAEVTGSLLFIPSVLVWGAAQFLAFAQILVVLTGVELQVALFASMLIIVTYTTLGGMLADAITDFVQAIVLIIGLIILLVIVVTASGGFAEAMGRVQPAQLSFIGEDESLWARLDVWAVPVLGSLVSQVALSKVLAARSPEVARAASFGAFGLYLTAGMVPVILALIAPHLGIPLGTGDEFLPQLASDLLPPVLGIIFMGALLSAILSTVDSTLLTISALVSHNVVVPVLGDIEERRKVWLARAVVIVAGVSAWVIAALGESILGLVLLADSIGTAGLVTAVLIGLYAPRFGGAMAALAAFAGGLVAFPIGEQILQVEAPYALSLATAVGAYVLVAVWEQIAPSKPVAVSR